VNGVPMKTRLIELEIIVNRPVMLLVKHDSAFRQYSRQRAEIASRNSDGVAFFR